MITAGAFLVVLFIDGADAVGVGRGRDHVTGGSLLLVFALGLVVVGVFRPDPVRRDLRGPVWMMSVPTSRRGTD